MLKAKLVLDRDFAVGRVDPRIYGSFAEHLGRCIYGGVYEPGHPTADEQGFRRDVLELVRGLDVPVVRYPGGNFVSGFNWEDSVGPAELRPRRLDLAWKVTEPNAVGMHEFYDWCKKAGSEMMYSINLGTRGAEAARDVVEYANHKGGSKFSDMRIANGKKEPMGIRLWCLGNEMDGRWQMESKTAYEYGRRANEAAKMMKWVDPSIELVTCGSSAFDMPTFGDWELQMLDECYENVDYVSLHRYYGNPDGDTASFLGSTADLDAFIRTVASICDAVKGKKHSRKRLHLSFDEWNVSYHSDHSGRNRELREKYRWGEELPILEDVYTFEDALLDGCILNTFLRNADRVRIACLAQLVNAIAPILTRKNGGAWAQTIYWPISYTSRYGRGVSLKPVLTSPEYECKRFGSVSMVDASAVLRDDGTVALFVVNRSLEEDIDLELDLRAFGDLSVREHVMLRNDDLKAVNTEEEPDNVKPVKGPGAVPEDGVLHAKLPRTTWNMYLLG